MLLAKSTPNIIVVELIENFESKRVINLESELNEGRQHNNTLIKSEWGDFATLANEARREGTNRGVIIVPKYRCGKIYYYFTRL